MRNISFALTTEQIRRREKTVTRRLGWKDLKPGTLLQPVEKAQGLKKGERVTKIGGPICVENVRRECLENIDAADCVREGFPELSPWEFIAMFCRMHNLGAPSIAMMDTVTRIEFSYVPEEA